MKKISLTALVFLGSFSAVCAQAKPAAAIEDNNPSQQMAALVKAITDSIKTHNQKSIPGKVSYGYVALKAGQVPVYNIDNASKLSNINLRQKEVGKENINDNLKYVFVQIDSVQVKFLKNAITWIHVYLHDGQTIQNEKAVELERFSINDTFKVEAQGTRGAIRLPDFLYFLPDTPISDNIESGIKTLTPKRTKISINGY